MAVVLLTGFSCGVPVGLSGGTLQAWMASEQIDITLIGIFSLVGLPYTAKFLWSPIIDRYLPPFLGRRRGWILIAQFLLVIGISFMAITDPVINTSQMAIIALLVAFFSASQDIAVDAYRTEVLKSDELGPGASLYIMGYRIAMIFSGAIALILADHMPWKTVYFIMAIVMGVSTIVTYYAPEPELIEKPPKTLGDAVILPFVEFLKRKGAFEILAFIVFYKLDVAIAMALATPFMLELGFTKTDIGAVMKGFGLFASIIGSLVGGGLMLKMGMRMSLWVFGLAQGISGASFMLLAHLGHNYSMLIIAVTVENICSGMGTAVFSAFIMSLCDKRFTATQYALLTSFMALTRVVVGAPTGYLAKAVGWEMYFLVSILSAIPGLLLLLRYPTWQNRNEQEATTVDCSGASKDAEISNINKGLASEPPQSTNRL